MELLERMSRFDTITKIWLIFGTIVITYILMICIVLPLIFSANGISEEYILSFGTPLHKHLNLVSIFIAIISGTACSIIIRPRDDDHDIKLIKSVLSKDEKELTSIVEKETEITQDSLKYRLGWSRAKLSTIITNLEKRGVLQRKREGKTYVIFLSKREK